LERDISDEKSILGAEVLEAKPRRHGQIVLVHGEIVKAEPQDF